MHKTLNLIVFLLSAIAFIIRYNILMNGLKEKKDFYNQKLYSNSFADEVKNEVEKYNREQNEYMQSELVKLILFVIPIKLKSSIRKLIIANICLFMLYAGLIYGIISAVLSEE